MTEDPRPLIRAWIAAKKAWDTDPCDDLIQTVQLGERLYYAASDLIEALLDD